MIGGKIDVILFLSFQTYPKNGKDSSKVSGQLMVVHHQKTAEEIKCKTPETMEYQ
jgi:hypothetical protein